MSYVDKVEEHLVAQYGDDKVEREVYLDETGRFADFTVDLGDLTLVIEVENESDDVVERGLAQALLYAQHGTRYAPVIYFKPDGDNAKELEMVGSKVALVPYEP